MSVSSPGPLFYLLEFALLRVFSDRTPDWAAEMHIFFPDFGWLRFYDTPRAFFDSIQLSESEAMRVLQHKMERHGTPISEDQARERLMEPPSAAD